MTHAELLMWLASQEIECPGPTDVSENSDYYAYPVEGQSAHSLKCECGGTGKVARFPTLRQECPRIRGYVNGHLHRKDSSDCYHCQGRGWISVDSLEVMVDAIFGAGFAVMFEKLFHTPHSLSEHFICRLFPLSGERQTDACGNTPKEALILAIYEIEARENKL